MTVYLYSCVRSYEHLYNDELVQPIRDVSDITDSQARNARQSCWALRLDSILWIRHKATRQFTVNNCA